MRFLPFIPPKLFLVLYAIYALIVVFIVNKKIKGCEVK